MECARRQDISRTPSRALRYIFSGTSAIHSHWVLQMPRPRVCLNHRFFFCLLKRLCKVQRRIQQVTKHGLCRVYFATYVRIHRLSYFLPLLHYPMSFSSQSMGTSPRNARGPHGSSRFFFQTAHRAETNHVERRHLWRIVLLRPSYLYRSAGECVGEQDHFN